MLLEIFSTRTIVIFSKIFHSHQHLIRNVYEQLLMFSVYEEEVRDANQFDNQQLFSNKVTRYWQELQLNILVIRQPRNTQSQRMHSYHAIDLVLNKPTWQYWLDNLH